MMTVVQRNPTQHGKNYSPQSPEPSEPSPISTPPMNVSIFKSWHTPHSTTDDNTFYSEDEPRRVYWTSPLNETFHSEREPRRIYLLSSQSPPSPPSQDEKEVGDGKVLSKTTGSVATCLRSLRKSDSPNKGHSRTVD